MDDREKVIKGLTCCRNGFCFACPYNDGVDGNVDCKQKWADDALALLKAQEPRVLTLDEARNCEVVWMEDRQTDNVIICLVQQNMNDSKLYKYGVQWRVWSARPTEEQRKAAKWNE